MDYDRILMALVQQTGCKLDDFLDKIFDFLRRNSDFFRIITPQDSASGFLPGEAANLASTVFLRHQSRYLQQNQPHLLENHKPNSANKSTNSSSANKSTNSASANKSTNSASANKSTDSASANKSTNSASASKSTSANRSTGNPGSEAPARPRFDPICIYGGGSTVQYRWSQTWDSIDIQIPFTEPGESVLRVDFKPEFYTVRFKTGKIVTESLADQIVPDESTWQLEGESVILNLAKKNSQWWWDRAHKDDVPKTATVAQRDIHDLKPRHQVTRHFDSDNGQVDVIRAIQDHQNRDKGIPTEEEMMVNEMISKATSKTMPVSEPRVSLVRKVQEQH